MDPYRYQVREIAEYAMFMVDPKGALVSWNAGVERLLGWSEQEWVGQHAGIIFTPADRAIEICETEMRKAEENGSATDIRWHRRKDGTEFFANGFMNAIRDDAGVMIGFVKILSDETPRKLLEDSLSQSNAALEQFAYVASHDLQEPLRTMSALAQLLAKKYTGKFDSEADRILANIIDASERMSTLVRDLLEYARSATEEKRPVSVALDEDLEAALSMLKSAVDESGARITHDALPSIKVDRGQMVRLFQNLIGNALKYRKLDQPPRIHVSAEQSGGEWIISVQDNGIGFDPQFAATVFMPFKRLPQASEYPGTGVGLAICKSIVEGQGGRIWAESEPGAGATFRFTIPLHDRAAKNNPRQ